MSNFNPCCCLSLRSGSKIIAIVEITFSIIFLGFTIYSMTSLAAVHNSENDALKQQVMDKIAQKHPEIKDKEPEAIFEILFTALGLLCGVCVLQVIVGSVLIHGIRQERLVLLKLWIIVKTSCLVFSVVFTIAIAATQQRNKTFGEIIMDVFSILLGLYFIYVVYRLYGEMQANVKNQQRPKPNTNSKPASVNYEYYG